MRKGVTALVSLLLILSLTLTSSLIFYIYYTQVSSKTQTETEEIGEELTEKTGEKIKINSLECRATVREGTAGYWSFNEKYGEEFQDLSFYDNPGHLVGDAILNGRIHGCKWEEGVNGKSLQFKRENYVELGDNEDLNIRRSLSLIGWFKAEGKENEFQPILAKNHLKGNYGIGFNPQKGILEGYLYPLIDGNFSGTLSYELDSDSKWHHFALVWDGSKAELYVDGDLKKSKTQVDGNLSIGQGMYLGNNQSLNQAFIGKLDEIAVFSRSLSSREIEEHYSEGKLTRGEIEAYWKFDQGFGNTAYDTHHIAPGKAKHGIRISEGAIEVNGSRELSPSNEITIEAFIKPEKEINRSSSIGHGIVCTSTFVTSYCLSHPPNKGRLKFELTGLNTLLSHKDFWENKWHHVAAVYNGEEMRIYVNGELDSSIKTSGGFQRNKGNVSLGNTKSTIEENYPGTIDELRISNKGLSSSYFLNEQISVTIGNIGTTEIPQGDWVINLKTEKNDLISSQTFSKPALGKDEFLSFDFPVKSWELREGKSYKVEINGPTGVEITQTCEGQ